MPVHGKHTTPDRSGPRQQRKQTPAAAFLLRWKYQLLCIALGFLLFFLASRFAPGGTDLIGGNSLKRDGYGRQAKTYEVMVEGLDREPVRLDIPVSSRKYSEEEIGRAFDACMDYLSVSILKDNPSLTEVSGNLELPSDIRQYGMRAEWTSPDPGLLDSFGTVKNENLKEAKDLVLKVHLADGNGKHSADYELPVRIVPPEISAQEKLRKDFLAYLKQEDSAQAQEETFELPAEYGGRTLSYSQKNRENFGILWVLGIVCAVLFSVRDVLNRKKEGEARRRQMLLDYPEIVSKLMVFIGAGMTIRLAWGNIVNDYEAEQGGKRYAYEEMSRAYSQLKTGANEGRVYRDFGRSCGLRQYMKLAGMLEQNRKTGIANIRAILSAETAEAWEERKNLARRMGEEASTKLLGPLFIMLLIVMTMIIIPAMMSFS